MAKIYTRERSTYWYALFKSPKGGKARRSTGIPAQEKLREQAQLKANQIELDAWNGWNPNQENAYDFEDLMLAYTKDRELGNADLNCINQLQCYFSGITLNSLGAKDINGYKQYRKKSNRKDGTVRRELAVFSAAINYARREWDWDIPNQVANRKPAESKGRVRWLTHKEARQLLAQAKKSAYSPHLADFVELALQTGMRKQEILGLEFSRIDLEKDVIYLNPEDQKNSQYSTIPMSKTAKQVVLRRTKVNAELFESSPYLFPSKTGHIKDVKRGFTYACQQVGILDFRIHDLRHTFASWLVQEGVSIYDVKHLLRHSSTAVTEKYSHLPPETTRKAVERLDTLLDTQHD